MEYQQTILLIAIAVLVGLALYFTLGAEVTEPPIVDTAEVETLLMKGVEFGKGEDNYVYSPRTKTKAWWRYKILFRPRGYTSSATIPSCA